MWHLHFVSSFSVEVSRMFLCLPIHNANCLTFNFLWSVNVGIFPESANTQQNFKLGPRYKYISGWHKPFASVLCRGRCYYLLHYEPILPAGGAKGLWITMSLYLFSSFTFIYGADIIKELVSATNCQYLWCPSVFLRFYRAALEWRDACFMEVRCARERTPRNVSCSSSGQVCMPMSKRHNV